MGVERKWKVDLGNVEKEEAAGFGYFLDVQIKGEFTLFFHLKTTAQLHPT